jgi:uncharacterized spore protein YtfJ
VAKKKSVNVKDVEQHNVRPWQSALDRFDRLFDAASHEAVFAEPIAAEGQTVISAAEVMIGIGMGGGGSFKMGQQPAAEDLASEEQGEQTGGGDDFGGGGGGGAFSRPVAVIVIDGDGVRVEPVVDATKVALAGITVFGSMMFMLARMWGAARRGEGGK